MKILITGGCGFIGCNTAERLSQLGHKVTILDNLSRQGTKHNLIWLQQQGMTHFVEMDIRNAASLGDIVRQGQFDVIIHLAGQVAVTTSVQDPYSDFEINAAGTLNLLEAVRLHSPHSIILYSSTNKVYGKLAGLQVAEDETRYHLPLLSQGVNEERLLDFYSPYGCSKGAADQYVIDYSRIYGLRTVCFRQSCIYGPRQLGVEDQGWIAWFMIAHLMGRSITIYGTGKQVRDALFIGDLVDCYLAAIERIDAVRGLAFNIGGGPANTISLLELMKVLTSLSSRPVEYSFSDWRPGDQPVYISDIRQAQKLLGWEPKISVPEGLERLYNWVSINSQLLKSAAVQ